MSRIQSILRKNSDSSSTSTPRATEMQMFANSGSDYGNIRLDDENFNIMQFWHQVKGVFQILASMACDILVVPVSTVASESCFSAANRALTKEQD
jgi:hAT family C-terminal dimerisation region